MTIASRTHPPNEPNERSGPTKIHWGCNFVTARGFFGFLKRKRHVGTVIQKRKRHHQVPALFAAAGGGGGAAVAAVAAAVAPAPAGPPLALLLLFPLLGLSAAASVSRRARVFHWAPFQLF